MRLVACLFLGLAASAIAVPTPLTAEDDGRIVNGTDAPPGKYPSQVSYQRNNLHRCGGSIINENWVLTAGHCVYPDSVSTITILSGTTDLSNGGSRRQALELVLHENFKNETRENDIALVRVDPPFTWDEMTRPVALAARDQETPGGSNATVIGWGEPYTGGGTMQNLQEVDYWTVSDQECMDAHYNPVFTTNICAYYPGGGKGHCKADSGGPLWVDGLQVGIVSWSIKPCTIAPYPGVFTEVSPFIDWIIAKISA